MPELATPPKPSKLREQRRLVNPVEIREAAEGKMPVVRGYAAIFNEVSDSGYYFREVIMPGAFTESLRRGDDVCALVEHDPRLIVARRGGTLTLGEDMKGLWYEFTPTDNQAGRDLVQNLRSGNIKGSSFAFVTDEDAWDYKPTDGGDTVRKLIRVSLFDISPVVYPYYEGTDVGLRSFYDAKRQPPAPAPAAVDPSIKARVAMMDV